MDITIQQIQNGLIDFTPEEYIDVEYYWKHLPFDSPEKEEVRVILYHIFFQHYIQHDQYWINSVIILKQGKGRLYKVSNKRQPRKQKV
jgi:hypothetical protein